MCCKRLPAASEVDLPGLYPKCSSSNTGSSMFATLLANILVRSFRALDSRDIPV
jgi:hypothetical protein